MTDELLEAARELGAALLASPVVLEYLQARDAVIQDARLQQLRQEMESLYQDTIIQQVNGGPAVSAEMNHFNLLRHQYTNNPLILHREECLEKVKALFEQAGSTISSIISLDYCQLVLE